ncbi:MAG TPA: hypothetical protein VED24_04075 [Candidatus Acidoferrum sp.]|nr:hypothetical protein [Candidatus Acidoferrum sp.]
MTTTEKMTWLEMVKLREMATQREYDISEARLAEMVEEVFNREMRQREAQGRLEEELRAVGVTPEQISQLFEDWQRLKEWITTHDRLNEKLKEQERRLAALEAKEVNKDREYQTFAQIMEKSFQGRPDRPKHPSARDLLPE